MRLSLGEERRYCFGMTVRTKRDVLAPRRAESELGGGANRLKAQHDKGKLSARERLDVLLGVVEGGLEQQTQLTIPAVLDAGPDDGTWRQTAPRSSDYLPGRTALCGACPSRHWARCCCLLLA